MFFCFMQERELGDEYGWKQVHGDVFRPPTGSLYFASLVGNGVQVAIVALLVTFLAFVGKVYTERGGLLSTVIFVYALLSPSNGFAGGRIYAQMGGKSAFFCLSVSSSFPSLAHPRLPLYCIFCLNSPLYPPTGSPLIASVHPVGIKGSLLDHICTLLLLLQFFAAFLTCSCRLLNP